MSTHFHSRFKELKRNLFSLAALVEDMLLEAVNALETMDLKTAQEVIEAEDKIDQLEVRLEEECLKTLALYHPVATDLRLVVTVLNVNSDLERIGDLAVNVAERVSFMAKLPSRSTLPKLNLMGLKSWEMLRNSLESLKNEDPLLARKVIEDDDEVDELNRRIFTTVQCKIKGGCREVEALIHLLSVSRYLERVADYATNIAEDTIYLVEGKIIRHRPYSDLLSWQEA